MGSVRKDIRSPGWQAGYRDRSGRQRTRTFLTKGEARTFLGTVETDLAKGTWTDPDLAKVRFSTYTTRWRESLSHLRPGTLNNVDSFLHCHILPGFGAWQIGRIEPADIRTFVAELVEKGLAPSTVAAVYRVLARILATAEIDGVIPGTPCRGIKLPRQTTSTEPCFLSPAEVRRLAEAIEDRYRVLVYTAAYTGMRWGELAGLGVQRLDLLRGTIEVTEALTEVNGHVRIGPTKTGKSRTLSIPRFLVELLGEHLATFPSIGGYVFSSAEGTPVGCKLRIPTPRNTKIALTGSGCQEVSKRASSVIRWERAGNGFDVTRRGIAGIAPNSKRPDSPGRFAQAAIEYSRRTPPSRSIRRICTEPSSGPSGTRGTGTSRSIPRCGLAEL